VSLKSEKLPLSIQTQYSWNETGVGAGMIDTTDIPDQLVERVAMMEGILIESATGGSRDEQTYKILRRECMSESKIRDLLPSFVRTYRSLDAFWPYIKNAAGTYAERRQIISEAFTPLMDYLDARNGAPVDNVASEILEKFDAEGVHAIWMKALERRYTDPDGAITVARTLLETVVKRILDESQVAYVDKDDLPKLYSRAAKSLNLAPDQHSEEPIKMILGGAINLVNGIGTLRNRMSDSHGRGGKRRVRPSPRHASLAVNTAGAIATFLVETYADRRRQ
jgi:hypothetical protein